jgi:hypothetical protein|tara:strand:+ start:1375 stop:1575 length:201 start_codon:yes stop_codon:yes gene_type:complete
MTDPKENIKNNQELRIFYERELLSAWDDYDRGKLDEMELMDIDWFYFENWVEPITEMGPNDLLYLN